MLTNRTVPILMLCGAVLVGCPKPGSDGTGAPSGARSGAGTEPAAQHPGGLIAAGCDTKAPIVVVSNVRFNVDKVPTQALVLHEAVLPLKSDPFFVGAQRNGESRQEITRAQAVGAGAHGGPEKIWLITGSGAEGTKLVPMKIVRYWAVRGGDGPAFTAIRAELKGPLKPTPKTPYTMYALRCKTAPAGLVWRPAAPLRPSRTSLLQTWGLPPHMVQALKPSSCVGPACRMKWAIQGVPLTGGGALFQLTVSHIHPKGKSKCNWKTKDLHGVFYRSGPKKPAEVLNKAGTLVGVVLVKGTLGGVVSNEDGQLQVHTPAPGAVGELSLTTDIRWKHINEESAKRHTLGPDCSP